MRPSPEFIRSLADSLGDAHVLTSPDELAYYGTDRCRDAWAVDPSVVVLPADTQQVIHVMRSCHDAQVAVVPSGGRTGLAGAATATQGELVLSLARMNKILELDANARIVRCEAGTTIGAVQERARAQGLMFPVDWAATGSAQVGGAIATNAGGIRVVKYGVMRPWVDGMQAVLMDGTLLELDRGLAKDNTGFDLRQLFVGSEGTLGVIVRADLRLTRPPSDCIVAMVSMTSQEALLELFRLLRTSSLDLSAYEFFDDSCLKHVLTHRGSQGQGPFAVQSPCYAVLEVEMHVREPGSAALEQARAQVAERLQATLEEATEQELISDAVIAQGDEQARRLWAWREEISESLHKYAPHKADVSLPQRALAQFLSQWRELVARELPAAQAVAFGHIGDGNLHLNLLWDRTSPFEDFQRACHQLDAQVFAHVQAMRGSISAEHGVGLLKRDFLHYRRPPHELELMRAIKRAFDPRGLLNPGKIFPPGGDA